LEACELILKYYFIAYISNVSQPLGGLQY